MPVLAIGLDSFDTAFTGCTTHLASLVAIELARQGYSLVDYPWLVRLNPTVPWKTRGNAAVAILVAVDTRAEAEKAVREAVLPLAKAYGAQPKATLAALYVEDAEPSLGGWLEARNPCLERLYHRAVHTLAPLEQAMECIRSSGEMLASIGLGRRGTVGAAAALGMEPRSDYTFELLAYRRPSRWLEPRRIDPGSVVEYDYRYRPLTFSNYDYEKDIPLIAPHGHDPVLYGVRGEEPQVLLRALEEIEAGEEPSHWMLYRSNQATNAHLRPLTASRARPYTNPVLVVRLEEEPRRLPGGHVVARASDHTGTVTLAAYRETGALREALLSLKPGDLVAAAGGVKPRRGQPTLNLEALVPLRSGRPPRPCCPSWCGEPLVQPPPRSHHHLVKPLERCLAPPKQLPRRVKPTIPLRVTLE